MLAAGQIDLVCRCARLKFESLVRLRLVSRAAREASSDPLAAIFPRRCAVHQTVARIVARPESRRWLTADLGRDWREVRRKSDRSRILQAVCLTGDLDLLRWCDRFGFNRTTARRNSNGALHHACLSGSAAMVDEVLVRYDLTLPDALSVRALAMASDHPDMARVLLGRFDWPVTQVCRCGDYGGVGQAGCEIRGKQSWPVVARHFGIGEGLKERERLALSCRWMLVHMLDPDERLDLMCRLAGQGQGVEVKWMYFQSAGCDLVGPLRAAAAAGHHDLARWLRKTSGLELKVLADLI